MMTKQARATLASELAREWFSYTNSRNVQEKQASAANFIRKIADSDASIQEKQAWARALSAALPWAAKGLAGLGKGLAKGKGLVGGALQRMGGASSYLGKGLSQGVTQGGNLSSRAGGGGAVRQGLGRLMQTAGGGMSRGGQTMAAASKAAPSMAKMMKGMAPGVANMQKGLAGQAGRNINMGAGATAAGAGLFGLGRASKGQQGPTPEQLQQYMQQMQQQGGGWQPRSPGAQY